MSTIERKDLIRAVLASRDELDPDLESELLEAVVHAQADAAGDSESARRAIETAVDAAVQRGAGHVDPTVRPEDDDTDASNEEDQA